MKPIKKWIPAYIAVDDENQICGVYFNRTVLEDIPNQKQLRNDSRTSRELLKQMDANTKKRHINF